MKILQVIPFLTPVRGGNVEVAYQLSQGLARRGHEVTLATTDFEFDADYARAIADQGVRVERFKCIANLELFLITPSMKRWLRNHARGYDIIHLHDFRSYQNNIAAHHALACDIPYVMHAHGGMPRIVEKLWLKRAYDHVYGFRLVRHAARLIANSKAEVENYAAMGARPAQIQLVYNGIDCGLFRQLPPPGLFKDKFNIPHKYVLFLGRLDKTKGLDFLVAGFARLLEEVDYPLNLVFVGPSGNYASRLLKDIEAHDINDAVRFVDFLSGVEKLAAYHDAELFATTANYRSGVLITPIESLLCNTPAVVTHEIGELFELAGINGLVTYGDVEELTDVMKAYLEDATRAQEMVDKGKRFVKECLTWDQVVARTERIYEDCIYHI